MKLPMPQPGSRTVASSGTPRRARAVVHGGDDGRGGVEGVERGALGAVVFLGREQRLQFLAEGLPDGVLVAAGHGIGKDREGDGTEAREAGQRVPLGRRGRPLLALDRFSVRMAARMSRALAFSPLAMTIGGADGALSRSVSGKRGARVASPVATSSGRAGAGDGGGSGDS